MMKWTTFALAASMSLFASADGVRCIDENGRACLKDEVSGTMLYADSRGADPIYGMEAIK